MASRSIRFFEIRMETLETILTRSKPDSVRPLAIASVITGCLSCMMFGVLSGIPAVICGHMALLRIKGETEPSQNKRLAVAGLVTGYIGIAMTISIIIALLMVYYGWLPPEYFKSII